MSDTNGQSANSQHRVASFLRDIEIGTRGEQGQIDWVAPNKGKYPLSHISTFQAVVSTAAKTYREYDEAVRASLDNARFMRNDCGIMECLEGRQRCTALLDWHIEAEDDKSQEQKDLVTAMTKIMSEISRFTEYRRVLLEAIWFGHHGIQNRYGWQNIGGHMRVLPTPRHHLDLGWQPIHGDKLVFRFDDGQLSEGAFEGQMGIRVGMGHQVGDVLRNRWKIEAAGRGMAYFLSEAEQKLCTVHTHMIEDAAFEDAMSAGSLHGVGVRSRIYWEWVQKQESLAFLMEYLERSAGGIELWHFPAGNNQAKEEVRVAATERLSNSRNVTLVPIPPGEEGSQYGVQIIEPGMGGIETLKDILTTYFGYRIKRYILGQVATTEAEPGSGMGSTGDAMKLDTFLGIVKYDATGLEETLTRQLLRPMQMWNFPRSRHIRLKFRIDTEDEDMEKKLEAYAKAYEMGLKIKARDIADMIGASLPGPSDDVLSRDSGQPPAGPGGSMPPGSMPPDGGGGDSPTAGNSGPNGDLGVTGHGADGDGSMGSISGNNKGPGLISETPTAAGLEDRRQRYSRLDSDWTDEDEKKHPRAGDGKFASKSDTGTGVAKVKVKVDNFGGKRWYAMADLPNGRQVTHSHEDKHEAQRLAHDEIRLHGYEPEEPEPREGDRNADGLVFHEGRWHREDAPSAMPIESSNANGQATHEEQANEHAANMVTDGIHDQARSEPAMDGTIEGQSQAGASTQDAGTVGGGGTGGLSQSDGRLGGRSEKSAAGRRRRRSDGERSGDAAVAPASGDSSGDVGGRGSDVGHGALDAKVSHVLSQPPTAQNPTDLSLGNWRYHSRDFFAGGVKAKFHNNLEAIKVLRDMEDEGRTSATAEEQSVLSKFVGWGQMPGLFNEYWTRDSGMSYDEFNNEKDKWNDERKQARAVMTDAEWETAKHATLNSHFTHPSVIDAHWQMARKLGFTGGRFLEPSAGVGYYLGMMPPDIAKQTRAAAVELDQTTGLMLKKLYPKAHVEVTGFENYISPDGFYDMVASNVPFGSYGIHDKRYNKHKAQIHDYFFLKSADLTKPGGLIMHVTSTGTMDKADDSIRRELAKTCDFVSAVRFPGNTHKANAGTEVVTDMVILRKRHPDEEPVTLETTPTEAEPDKPGFTGTTTDSLGRVYHWVDGKRVPAPDWFGTRQVPDPAGGDPLTVNAYFADHPEQILGTLDRTGSMYRGESMNVSRTDDYEERLQAAIDRLPAGVFKPVNTAATGKGEDDRTRKATGDVKDGGYVLRDGDLYRREGGAETRQNVAKDGLGRIAGQLAIRDARQAVIDAELNGEQSGEHRAKLNTLYDGYVAKYGPLSSKENKAAMKGDPDAPNLLALEKWDAKKKTADKADIFSKETVRPRQKATHAENVVEGVGISLNELGVVSPEHIAELTGKSVEDVGRELTENGLAYEDPASGWTAASLYLSGNVRQKLVMARAAAAADPKYTANVTALEQVQPDDIGYEDIDVKLGTPWVPATDVQAFATELVGVHSNLINVNYIPETGEWRVGWKKGNPHTAKVDQFGTSRKGYVDILNAVLNNRSLSVYDEDDDGKRYINEAESKAVEEKASEIRDQFGDWVWSDDDRRRRLHRFYNDNFNNIRPVEYDGSHLTFPGMNPAFNMRDIQKNFVWRVITEGRGLAAHEVGTGKTASMIASAMELRRLGLAKKPCLAVLKANIEQITSEAKQLYPGIKILSTADMFDAANRKATAAKIATGDYDLVVMTHDHMDMMPMKSETVQKYIQEELSELEAAKEQAWQEDPSKNNRVVKALEDAKSKLETRLKDAIDAEGKDNAVHFEETGIDQIFVDEAHNYKSLPVYSHGERVKGVPQSRSDRATNMLMRTRWLMERNGNRGVVFATGTPVANTMAELFNIQRYLQPDELKERGIGTFDAWAGAFGERQTQVEPTASGGYDSVTRFSKFVNIPELMHIASGVVDVQRADDLKKPDGSPVIVRPHRHDHIVSTAVNPLSQRLMAELRDRAMKIKSRGGKPEKGADNMAVVCSDGRKGSVDARMLYADAPDDPNSKLNKCVDNILKLHKDRPGVTQLVFSDVGVNPSSHTGFHLYGELINKLVEGGIPRERIADFSTLEGAKKDAAQEAMRRGDIVVGIGSTKKLGTGVNVQNRIAAMHHLDVPWQPAEIEQRDGRGYRHGNKNDPTKEAKDQNVDIHRYVSEGTLDEFMWQLVANKAHFIHQVVGGKSKHRSVSDEDTETLTPEQLMAVASGDKRILRKVQLESDLRDLRTGADRHQKDQARLKDEVRRHQTELIPEHEEALHHFEKDLAHLQQRSGGDFAMGIGGVTHFKTADADAALERQLKTIAETPWHQRHRVSASLGEHKGFEIHAHNPTDYTFDGGHVDLIGPSGRKYQARATAASIGAVLRGIQKSRDDHAAKLQQLRSDAQTIQSQIGGQYRRSQELAEKTAELKRIDAELRGDANPVTPAPPAAEQSSEKYSRRSAPSLRDTVMQAVMRHLTQPKP